jgi:uncharacterized iron-regulated membrane protein
MQTDTAGEGPHTHAFYFTAWRWHFYAGLYVAPFLIILALSGLVMLWTHALGGINGDGGIVTPMGSTKSIADQATAASATVPGGTVTQYIAPMSPDRVAIFKVAAGETEMGVAINPHDGRIVSTFPWGQDWYAFASDIHGTLLMGTLGDRLIELAASLGIILIVTGIYLWWPRDGQRATLRPNLAARGRAWWKSLHQVTGVWAAGVLLVFLISGLSWTGIWGEKLVQAWNTFPAAKYEAPQSSDLHASINHDAKHEVPWALEQTPLPASGSLEGVQAISGPVTLNSVTDFAASLGFDNRYQLNLPQGETGVWTISHDSMSHDGPDPTADRTLHIDQFTGNVLADVRYADYTIYARAMAAGIAFHQGDLGLWNLALNTLFCLSVLFLSASGIVMWWKRRPAGVWRLVAPPMPAKPRLWKGAAILMLMLGLAFPLAGAALLGAILLDLSVLRFVGPLRRALS